MGAAMSNLLFAAPTTRVGYLVPSYMRGRFFLNMESVLGRPRVDMLFCRSLGATPSDQKANIAVDMTKLNELYEAVMNA
jgi:hypothetical protein